jgi:hypothetical protein
MITRNLALAAYDILVDRARGYSFAVQFAFSADEKKS